MSGTRTAGSRRLSFCKLKSSDGGSMAVRRGLFVRHEEDEGLGCTGGRIA